MTPTKIHLLTSTPLWLLVIYTDGGCWQFRVATSEGAVFGLQKIYYSAEAAERAGREWVGLDCEVRSPPSHPRMISTEVRHEKNLPSVQRKVSQNNFIFARIASGGRINEIKCLY